ACWTFVSDGLIAYGQKEMVFTVARRPDEQPEAIAREVGKFFSTVQKLAAQGRRVDFGDISVFDGAGPAGARGFAYIRPEALDGVDVPSSAVAAIALVGAEAQNAAVLGVNRVMGRLAKHYRYYPCPPWWDRDRTAIAAPPGEDTSILTRFARGRVPGVSALAAPDGLRLRVHQSARDKLARVLDERPPNATIALLTDFDPTADGLFVWVPGTDRMEAATAPSSRGARLALAFAAFAPGTTEDGGRIMEDGMAVMFTERSWDAFLDAV